MRYTAAGRRKERIQKITIAGYKAFLRVQSERSGGVPPLSIRAGRSTSFRSALEPNIHYSRSLLIERHAGVMFPDTLIPGAGYKVSLRVQSERSERLRELTPAARRRELPSAGARRKYPWGARTAN